MTKTGLDAFITDLSPFVAAASPGRWGTIRFVLQVGERYAFIRLGDLYHPLRFLRQLEGAPPVAFPKSGFSPAILEAGDAHPTRHYTAFLYLGFWLPYPLAVVALYAWEILGFVRYGGHWSTPDMRSGRIGIRHGALVRRYGPTVLPGLIAGDLAERE